MECREKLIRLRKRQGLTQQELAETVNVSRQSISKWELGAAQPSIENFRSLSTFYGVPVDLLLNDVLDLPEAGCVLSEMPVQKNGSDPAGDCVQGDELKKEISALKKWMIGLVAVVTALVLTAAVYVVENLWKESDAIPIDELEQEYIGDSFDGEFDHGW
ncbi:MAG: helix-turn-helix domain-containing protein [Oscillospiraceae bacterium]|nr:helix-turn-helix domain-containing protein [Oscillospiraceae bacterium]